MKALIFEDKVVDVVETAFPLPEAMSWMDAPEGCVAGEWLLVDGVIVAPPAPPALTYDQNRQFEYPTIGDQLDMIYKDNLNSTTTHKDAVEVVKTKWPKNNTGPVE